MVTRKFSKLVMIGLLAATMAGAAMAQDGGQGGKGGPGGRGGMGGRGMGGGPGIMMEIVQRVAEETELTPRDVAQDLLDGQTAADILKANGDDPEAFVTTLLTEAKTRLDEQVTNGKLTQEQADQRYSTTETDLRAFVFEGKLPIEQNQPGQPGEAGQRRPLVELGQIIIEQAELDLQAARQALRDGKSLETQITEAGKDVATVKQASIDAATKAINDAVTAGNLTQERADQMISNLESVIDRLLKATGPLQQMGQRGGARLEAAVAEATGLTVDEVHTEITAGKTLADVLSSKSITVDTFVEEHLQPVKDRLAEEVTSGKITQAIADARLELARVELTERLNGTFQPKGPMDQATPLATPEATAES